MTEERTTPLPYLAEAGRAIEARFPGRTPLALVRTYGCQQNVADGEIIKGILGEMGFGFTSEAEPTSSSLTPAPCGSTPRTGSSGTWGLSKT